MKRGQQRIGFPALSTTFRVRPQWKEDSNAAASIRRWHHGLVRPQWKEDSNLSSCDMIPSLNIALDLNEKRTATRESLALFSLEKIVRPQWKEDSNSLFVTLLFSHGIVRPQWKEDSNPRHWETMRYFVFVRPQWKEDSNLLFISLPNISAHVRPQWKEDSNKN